MFICNQGFFLVAQKMSRTAQGFVAKLGAPEASLLPTLTLLLGFLKMRTI